MSGGSAQENARRIHAEVMVLRLNCPGCPTPAPTDPLVAASIVAMAVDILRTSARESTIEPKGKPNQYHSVFRGQEAMNRELHEVTLPGGMKVDCRRESEAVLVSEQVQLYFRHGVNLQPGATVFDVGANIGLFTLLVHERCHGDVDVFAVEPIPASLEALRRNVARLGSNRVRVLACGLGASRGSAVFSYYRHHSTLSTAYGATTDEQELSEQLCQSFLRNLDQLPVPLRWVLRWLPPSLRLRLMRALVARSFRNVEQVPCEIRTVSDIVEEYDVKRIDLLKVDVEKAELEVLNGIAACDWPKVQQVVMEVHDIGGRLQAITDLLMRNGLGNVIAEQEPALRGSNVYALYAARGPLAA
jgi:FkbM family methyltransferase